ncbi:hypothetical protein [Nocardioides nanhaiensis]|uniref:EthD domain-containing protein n=1 Tax=Nocardioides nanhaiensis TaxID=1476871 RepID=A0ABP8W998_9ACTN
MSEAQESAGTGRKLVFAGRAVDHAALLDPAWHTALAGAGVERLQLNLDDEPVAGALRLSTGEPFTAVVSLWTDGADHAAATSLVTALAGEWHGWEVEERRPLPPPEVWDDCERVPALANVALLRRPAELDDATWRHRWLVDHTPVAIATQGTFGYVQNVVRGPVVEGSEPVAALVEELFPAEAVTDVHAFYGSGGDRGELERRMTAMMASVARFGADRDLDLVPTGRRLVRLVAGAQGGER